MAIYKQPRSFKGSDNVRSLLNNTGSEIGAGLVVALDSTKEQMILPASQTDICYGVTMEAIADGAHGNVQILGTALVQASAALATPGIELEPETDGQVSSHGGSNTKIGILKSTAGAAGDLVEVELYARKTP